MSPSAFRCPIRSLFHNSQTPAITATRSPKNRVTERTPPSPTPTWTRWARSVPTKATAVDGAIHERTAPGVARFWTHPHPRPLV